MDAVMFVGAAAVIVVGEVMCVIEVVASATVRTRSWAKGRGRERPPQTPTIEVVGNVALVEREGHDKLGALDKRLLAHKLDGAVDLVEVVLVLRLGRELVIGHLVYKESCASRSIVAVLHRVCVGCEHQLRTVEGHGTDGRLRGDGRSRGRGHLARHQQVHFMAVLHHAHPQLVGRVLHHARRFTSWLSCTTPTPSMFPVAIAGLSSSSLPLGSLR